MKSVSTHPITIVQLWREFLPLSLSDVTMACGDPLMTTTLAHLPDARNNLAGVGIAKALAVFFESPIIMILHAANALAAQKSSRRILWRFVLLSGGILSILLILLAISITLPLVGQQLFGIPTTLVAKVQQVLLFMGLWPFAIAWRRYFQGLLIHHGHSAAIAQASLYRLGTVGVVLAIGWGLQASGTVLAGLALILGVMVEAIAVTIAAKQRAVFTPASPTPVAYTLPQNLLQVWQFYWPLANSMLIVWGGRALLIGLVARAVDAPLALAAWPAAWGLVLVIANSTRMVQQMIIKYRGQVSDRRLLLFALTVGGLCSTLLLGMSRTTLGAQMIQAFIGNDRALVEQIKPVILVCSGIPLLVAVQNATQVFLVSTRRTGSLNLSTWLGTGTLLGIAGITIRCGWHGAIAAATAMMMAMTVEVGCLLGKHYR
jgi:progressive ankylosis protein